MTNRPPLRRLFRYSPEPIDAYGITVGRVRIGPAQLRSLADHPACWNLAFLSFDYAAAPVHPDPRFAVHVLDTVRFVLRRQTIDIHGREPLALKVEGLLQADARTFLDGLLDTDLYRGCALWRAYGDRWLGNMHDRVGACRPDPAALLLDHIDEMPDDLGLARQLLARFA